MKDDLVVLDGSTFFVSDRRGDADGNEANGYFFRDTRHLSRWQLLVDRSPLYLLTGKNLDDYSARLFGTLAGARVGVNSTVTVQRDRVIAGGVHEDIYLENHSNAGRRISVELRFAADFADLFEIKERSEKRGRTWVEPGDGVVTLWYERQGFKRGTRILSCAQRTQGTLPAAGLPWFMALFGRDSILTSYALLPFHARLAATTLETLAGLQAKERDDFRDAHLAKILHELRLGELSTLGETPHSPYYGAHDVTALFLILLTIWQHRRLHAPQVGRRVVRTSTSSRRVANGSRKIRGAGARAAIRSPRPRSGRSSWRTTTTLFRSRGTSPVLDVDVRGAHL